MKSKSKLELEPHGSVQSPNLAGPNPNRRSGDRHPQTRGTRIGWLGVEVLLFPNFHHGRPAEASPPDLLLLLLHLQAWRSLHFLPFPAPPLFSFQPPPPLLLPHRTIPRPRTPSSRAPIPFLPLRGVLHRRRSLRKLRRFFFRFLPPLARMGAVPLQVEGKRLLRGVHFGGSVRRCGGWGLECLGGARWLVRGGEPCQERMPQVCSRAVQHLQVLPFLFPRVVFLFPFSFPFTGWLLDIFSWKGKVGQKTQSNPYNNHKI